MIKKIKKANFFKVVFDLLPIAFLFPILKMIIINYGIDITFKMAVYHSIHIFIKLQTQRQVFM